MTGVLFIGGPWDGHRKARPPNGIRFKVMEARPFNAGVPRGIHDLNIIEHEYRLMQYGMPEKLPVHTLWVHSTIEDHNVVGRLMEGYSAKCFAE